MNVLEDHKLIAIQEQRVLMEHLLNQVRSNPIKYTCLKLAKLTLAKLTLAQMTIYIVCLFFVMACSSDQESEVLSSRAVYHSIDKQKLVSNQSKPHLSLEHSQKPKVKRLIKEIDRRCELNQLWQCQQWLNAYQNLAYDIRQVKKHAELSMRGIHIWTQEVMSLLQHHEIKQQVIAAELLTIIVERLKFRSIPQLDDLTQQINQVIEQSEQPLQKSKLIIILSHLMPLGTGEVFYRFVDSQESSEVQTTAWDILTERHSKQEPIRFKAIQKAMKRNSSLSVKASLIRAATPLKSSKLIAWCGKEWWRNELYLPCRDAISSLDSERASLELWRWIKSIFEEYDQTISADLLIAEALTYLSPNVRSRRAQRRYRKLLDLFFKRRRAEKAAILVAQSWLKLPSSRYALETSLRYFRPKIANIAVQSHFFEQALKRIIYQLSNPLNIDK